MVNSVIESLAQENYRPTQTDLLFDRTIEKRAP